MGAVLALARWRPVSRRTLARLLTWRLATLGLAVAGVAVLADISVQLLTIGAFSRGMQKDALPAAIAQQKRAIWTENLRSAADIVVFAGEEERRDALAKAEQLAANLNLDVRPEKRQAVEHGLMALTLAAQASRRAEQLDQEIKTKLIEANEVIGDMRANLASIVEDSSGTLARLLREALDRTISEPPSRADLEEVLAINTTSQDLLASLDRGRILLADARTMEQPEELQRAAARFEAIGRQLRARVETLRGNSDYEYLPVMIERFIALGPVFRHRESALRAEAQALASRLEAKRRLGVLRENLAADAASRAEAHIASIVATVRHTEWAFTILLLLLLLGTGAARSRARSGGPEGRAPAAATPPGEAARARLEQQAALLRQVHVGLENLAHWRDNLPARLRLTLRHLLAEEGEVEAPGTGAARCAPEAVGERRVAPEPPVPPLPPAVEERLPELFDLVWSLDRELVAASHEASEQLLASGAAEAAPRDATAPALRLELLALAVDEAVIVIGSTLNALNQHARSRAGDHGRAVGAAIDAIDHLSGELVTIRARLRAGPEAPAGVAA